MILERIGTPLFNTNPGESTNCLPAVVVVRGKGSS